MDGLQFCHRRRNLRRLAKIGDPPLCQVEILSTTVCHVRTCTCPDVRTDILF